jgi:hypothetical protein
VNKRLLLIKVEKIAKMAGTGNTFSFNINIGQMEI